MILSSNSPCRRGLVFLKTLMLGWHLGVVAGRALMPPKESGLAICGNSDYIVSEIIIKTLVGCVIWQDSILLVSRVGYMRFLWVAWELNSFMDRLVFMIKILIYILNQLVCRLWTSVSLKRLGMCFMFYFPRISSTADCSTLCLRLNTCWLCDLCVRDGFLSEGIWVGGLYTE